MESLIFEYWEKTAVRKDPHKRQKMLYAVTALFQNT